MRLNIFMAVHIQNSLLGYCDPELGGSKFLQTDSSFHNFDIMLWPEDSIMTTDYF